MRDLVSFIDEEINYNVLQCLLCFILGVSKIEDFSSLKISDNEFLKLNEYILQIKKTKIPFQYLINSANFYGYDFFIKKPVLIPRMDSECIIEQAVEIFRDYDLDSIEILDLCCGSGCLGISFYLEVSKLFSNLKKNITFVDIDKNAIDVLNVNIDRFLIKNSEILKKDILADFSFFKKYDVIFFNPPYISESERLNLDKNVINFESEIALFGGKDGLLFYKTILPEIDTIMSENAKLFLEIGSEQYYEVLKINKKFKNISLLKDLAGRNRCIILDNRN